MRVLVFGAGVLGSLYAARLHAAGAQVSILARGNRAAEIRTHGIVLVDEATGRETAAAVPVVEGLAPTDGYDLVMVLIRRDQLESALPVLAANCSPAVLFMCNNASGPGALVEALGPDRVMLGFPGAGGSREGHKVRCRLVSGRTQPTTVGELTGEITPRLRAAAGLLRQAGFPTAFSANMDAWLKTHAAIVCPVANGFYFAGDNYRLAQSAEGLRLMLEAVREGLRGLEALRIPVEPARYRVLRVLPDWVLLPVLRRLLATRWAELVLWRHADTARSEMRVLSEEFRALLQSAGLAVPATDRLMESL